MSNETKHTPEPWKVNATPHSSNQSFVILDSGANGHSKRIAAIYSDHDAADARRIVACVNACAGMETETLEGGRNALQTAISLRDEAIDQRDALAAALVRAQDHVIMAGTLQTDNAECLAQIKAALANLP